MKSFIKQIPVVEKLRRFFKEKEYKRRFATDLYAGFWGVFETFEQAQQASPRTKSIGYDNPDLAKEYQEMLEDENWEGGGRMIASYDYPVLFWLQSIFDNDTDLNIFDFGGNVGIHFYGYSKYLKYPDNLHWTVCDLPEIIKAGRKIAEKRNVKNLTFTNSFEEADCKNIFIASGSIQYIGSLVDEFDSLTSRPSHILINRLPLYHGKQFVTLQNGGKVFYPQYVFNKTEFIESIVNIGYELIDIWQDNVDSCRIPFHPENSVQVYSGLYFKLRS